MRPLLSKHLLANYRFAVWIYFFMSLIGSQTMFSDPTTYIPIFLILKFIFFFGWLEVAEAIENPFGNDADDFHICQLVSRHLWAIGKNLELYDGPPPLGVVYFISNHSTNIFLTG